GRAAIARVNSPAGPSGTTSVRAKRLVKSNTEPGLRQGRAGLSRARQWLSFWGAQFLSFARLALFALFAWFAAPSSRGGTSCAVTSYRTWHGSAWKSAPTSASALVQSESAVGRKP